LWQLWPQALLVGFPFILVLIQPDLGTSGLVLGIAAIQILLLPVRWWHLFVVGCFALAATFFAWNFVLYDYQKQRIFTFLDPTIDPQGSGYHTIQSMISIGHGGLWGQGFNQGTQSKLNFLPEPHTDFAFSVWAEEHGFVGAVVLITVYFLLVASIFHLSRKFRNNSFATLTIVGIGAFFLLHGFINIGMVIGYLPVVGVPLTFFSYGGTHMISAFICLTILSILAKHRTV
jgi:rod shape determining protein RodA